VVRDVARRDESKTKPAIIFQDTEISYAAIDATIERAANGLAARGIGHGDRVSIMLPNLPQFVIAYYAVQRIGGTVVPINVLYKAEEIAYVLNDSEAAALFVYEGFYPSAAEALPNVPSVAHVFFVGTSDAPGGTTPWSALMDGAAPERPPVVLTPDDLATICYTSGTTGRSKGAMLSHRNFLANCEQCEGIARFKLRQDDRVLLVLPLFHIYSMNVAMNASLRMGATIVLISRFEPGPVLEQIQKYRCTILYGAPPMFVAWVNYPELTTYDLSSLRVAGSGAAALPVQILEAFRDFRNPVSITTKSPMVLRDLDILADLAKHAEVTVHFTVTTMDEALWRAVEPTTAKPRKRLEALQTLHQHGIRTGVFLSPILPGLTDDDAHLEEVVAAAAEYGAQFLFSQPLRLGPGISDYYLPFIEREFPELLPTYTRLYGRNYPPAEYAERIQRTVRALKERYGLVNQRVSKHVKPHDPMASLDYSSTVMG